MRKTTLTKLVALLFMVMATTTEASAQKWLKKLGDNLEKATSNLGSAATTASELTEQAADSAKTINWDAIPNYTLQEVTVTGSDGQPLLNEDGTKQVKVFLVDQFGNKRSAEAVKAQQNKLNTALGNILLKVGGGGLIGGLSKGVEGALVGAGTGALLSINDIKMAKKQKASLKQQKKLLAFYEKNYTAEGTPVNATVDTSKLATDLGIEKSTTTATAEELKKELADASFNTTDDSAFDF